MRKAVVRGKYVIKSNKKRRGCTVQDNKYFSSGGKILVWTHKDYILQGFLEDAEYVPKKHMAHAHIIDGKQLEDEFYINHEKRARFWKEVEQRKAKRKNKKECK